jgi:LuxR family transcriptional regulator
MANVAGLTPSTRLVPNFIRDLNAVPNMDAAMDTLMGAAESMGYRRVSYSHLSSPRLPDGRWAPLAAITRNYPANWDADWKRHGTNCPYYHACFEGSAVLRWSRVRERREALQSSERDCMHYLEDKQLVNGITVPIHLPGGQFAFVTVLDSTQPSDFDELFPTPHERLYFVAHEFHDTIFRRFPSSFPKSRPYDLSSREVECLVWAARGKTTEETAQIIDRSFETVRAHLKSSIRKLAATNRSHAIAKACWMGIIDAHN